MPSEHYAPSSKSFDGIPPLVGLGVEYSNMELSESESLEYFYPSVYDPGSAISMPSEQYSSEPLSYGAYTASWQHNGDPYESPLISERSSSGHSASSNESSNCFELDLSSTEDLSSTSAPYYIGPERIGMRPNSNTNQELLRDLRLPHSIPSGHVGQGGNDRVYCTEGCTNISFGRSYDLKRHVDEQHRCPHERCTNLKFTTARETTEHRAQHGVGFRCGTCELRGDTPNSLIRAEKLKKHFKRKHKQAIDLDLADLQCNFEPCFVGKGCGGLFFVSSADLKEHHNEMHPSALPFTERSRIDSGHSSPFADDISTSPAAKRRLERSPTTESKRWKVETNGWNQCAPGKRNMTPIIVGVVSGSQKPSMGYSRLASPQTIVMGDTISNPHNLRSTPDSPQHQGGEILATFNLSIVELQSLTKQHKLGAVIAYLDRLNISSTFNCKEGLVCLRGSCSPDSMDKGKLMLSKLIEKVKVTPFRKHDSDSPSPAKTKPSVQQVSVHPQPAMVTLHPDEDAEVLKTWHHYLLPKFPKFAREAYIKGSYSVGLIGQSSMYGKIVIIRFRSSENQCSTSREIIRDKVKKVCEQNQRPPLDIQFSEGTVVRLVGGSSTQFAIDDPSIDDKFPHQRRPWKKPGMGASIGLDECSDMSATLGGYVLLDGVMHMLSVDHFISECRCGKKSSKLRSPSLCDAEDVKEQLEKKLDEIHLKVSRLGYSEVPLQHAGSRLFSGDINEELEQYKRFERELEDSENAYALGMVRWRCGEGEHPLRLPVNPTVDQELRRMDWSLTEITERDRDGQNTHRHRRGTELALNDLSDEINNPKGSGMPCKETGRAVGGEGAHYVGTTSGYREGTINAALQLHIDEEGNPSHEWTMVVPECERLPDAAFKGDSGAWIIGNDSNKLLGLLWGWDGGLLLFTPIQDVFEDIKRNLRNCDIQLPDFEESGRSRRGSTLLCRNPSVHSIERAPKKNSTITEPAMATPQILLPPDVDEKSSLERTSSTSSLFSLPSLASSSSSSSLYEDATMKTPLPDQRLLHDEKSRQWLAPPKVIHPRSLDDYGWHLIQSEDAMSEDEHTPWESNLQIRCKPRMTRS